MSASPDAAVAADAAVPATKQIAEFILDAGIKDLDEATTRMAARAFIDTIGVAVAGAREPVVQALSSALDAAPRPAGATDLTTGNCLPAKEAAIINATAGHALDFDDHLGAVNGHPSVVLVPPILAICQEQGRSGMDALRAYVIGHQVMCAISAALPVRSHWTMGWHATETVGVLGVAAAAGHLLGLSVAQLRNAIGIGASMAAGSRQNCGFSVKPVHAGMAAGNGVLAAQLALGGVDADPTQLEAPLGFFKVFGVDSDLTALAPVLAERWTLTSRGLNVKAFPACYAVHPAGEAAAQIAAGGVLPDQIEKIHVTVQPTGLTGPIHHDPRTVSQARFSMEFAVAAALANGALNAAAYCESTLASAVVQDLVRRVTTTESPTPPFGEPAYEMWYATVEVTTTEGRVHRARRNMPHGYAHDPLSDAELDAKFLDCLATPGSAFDGPTLLSQLRSLPVLTNLATLLSQAATR